MHKPLFNPNLLEETLQGFAPYLTREQRDIVDNWSRTAADTRFREQNEKPLEATEIATTRYRHHEAIRHRILTDLGQPGDTLNQKLTAWYDLDFRTFRAELKYGSMPAWVYCR